MTTNNNQEKKFDTSKPLASNNQMTEYLKNFADKRPDIFGSIDDQFNVGEEKKLSNYK